MNPGAEHRHTERVRLKSLAVVQAYLAFRQHSSVESTLIGLEGRSDETKPEARREYWMQFESMPALVGAFRL